MSGHEPATSGTATPSAASNSPSTQASAGTVTTSTSSSVITPSSSQFQRLKVEDALSYLDQVKLQFGNHPEVYNNFLDIMKEFKSQSIDTPGVISRVSSLFKGHPDLIVGFNTFLPPGFKIEVHGQNEINIQGPAQHSHTLQQIALRHNAQNSTSSSSATTQSASSQSLGYSRHPSSSGTSTTSPSNVPSSQKSTHGMSIKPHGIRDESHQPVEFNHAINYVNKIKNRFQGQPDVYKAFLEILHTYQKEQRVIKEQGGTPCNTPLSESEVYIQVSKLFQNQEDLLSEFGQFLPDATSGHGLFASPLPIPHPSKKQTLGSSKSSKAGHARRTSQSSLNNNSQPPAKKSKSSAKEVLAEAGKHSNYAETALFDKIRKAIHNQEVYENFLRCLVLFNEEIVSRQELIQLVTPFLGKFPDLFCQYKSMLGFKEPSTAEASPETSPPPQFPPKERVTEFAAEIDFNSLKRHGASYRALPKTYVQPKCSGRTQLCRELLNDTWVSFPMWSEDSTFQGTRKTQYEEYIFRCEDERFELDIVLEGNLSTIKILEAIQKKMARMGPEELSKFTLDDRLGGNSEFIHRKALHRIYGERASDVVQGLKSNPSAAIPVVLKRLKLKQEEWLDAQRSFNRIWREQLEKYYLKSLDHLGITFKQVDTRAMKAKTLINEIENIYDERLVDGKTPQFPAHLVYTFPADKTAFSDSVGLIMYYVKRASTLSGEEASKIRMFLVQLMADFCYYPRVELNSDDDISLDTDSDAMEVDQPMKDGYGGLKLLANSILPDPPTYYSMLDYHVIFTNSTIYTFFRLFQFLCERLSKLYQQAQVVVQEQALGGGPTLQESVAVKLGLKKMPEIPVEEYYPTFLNLAKNFMDGSVDGPTYEDTCREMFGVHAYVVFTIDRLIQNIVRQLHSMVGDDNCLRILEQYTNFVENIADNGPSLSMAEAAYQKKIEGLVGDDNCYKITMTKNQKFLIELMEPEESSEENGADTKKWESYVSDYVKEEQSLAATREMNVLVQQRKIFLRRSHRNLSVLSVSVDEFEKSCSLDQTMLCFDTQGSIEFKMDERSYRMIPLANSEDYLYRRTALTRAQEVTPNVLAKKQQRFNSWYSKWSKESVTEEMNKSCKEWFFGRARSHPGADSIPCVPSQRISEEHYGQQRNRYITD